MEKILVQFLVLTKVADLLSSIPINKLEPKEIDQLVEILKDDSKNITW